MKKMPLKEVGIAAGVGVAGYLAGVQLVKASTWAAANWYATPLALAAVGLLVARKHAPIGLGLAGAAGALGYFQYASAHGQAMIPAATATTSTQSTQPPTSSTTPAQGTGGSTTADNSNMGMGDPNNPLTGTGQGTGVAPGTTGTTNAGTDATGSTTAGYSAGALLGQAPPPWSHMATWQGRRQPSRSGAHVGGAGALVHGPAPVSHMPTWRRNAGAGHMDEGDAGSLSSD